MPTKLPICRQPGGTRIGITTLQRYHARVTRRLIFASLQYNRYAHVRVSLPKMRQEL
jgi:hypothetical protein